MAVHSYLRISTLNKGQTVENQRLAIQAAGYATDYWYEEEGVSGSVEALQRPEFARMMSQIEEGSVLVVTALDRMGRDAADVLNTTRALKKMDVKVIVLNMGNMDITSTYGTVFAQITGALAELERVQIQERVMLGLERTRKEGTVFGRSLTIPPEILSQLCDRRNLKITLKQISEEFSLDPMTIQRNTKKWNGKMEEYKELYNKQQKQIEANLQKRVKQQ